MINNCWPVFFIKDRPFGKICNLYGSGFEKVSNALKNRPYFFYPGPNLMHHEALKFDAFLGFDALAVGMFDFGHLRHQIGVLDQLRQGVTPRDNDVHPGGPLL